MIKPAQNWTRNFATVTISTRVSPAKETILITNLNHSFEQSSTLPVKPHFCQSLALDFSALRNATLTANLNAFDFFTALALAALLYTSAVMLSSCVCPSVCPSLRHKPVLYQIWQNGQTYNITISILDSIWTDAKSPGEILRESPHRGSQIQLDDSYRTLSFHISETVQET